MVSKFDLANGRLPHLILLYIFYIISYIYIIYYISFRYIVVGTDSFSYLVWWVLAYLASQTNHSGYRQGGSFCYKLVRFIEISRDSLDRRLNKGKTLREGVKKKTQLLADMSAKLWPTFSGKKKKKKNFFRLFYTYTNPTGMLWNGQFLYKKDIVVVDLPDSCIQNMI